MKRHPDFDPNPYIMNQTTVLTVHFEARQELQVTANEIEMTVKPVGRRELSFAEKLAMFDPIKHGGEIMATKRVGVEAL